MQRYNVVTQTEIEIDLSKFIDEKHQTGEGGHRSSVLTNEMNKPFPDNSDGRGIGMPLRPAQSRKPELQAMKQQAMKLQLQNCLVWSGHCVSTKGHALECDYLQRRVVPRQ